MSDANVVKLLQPGSFADPLTEVLRNGARALLAQAIEAEVAEFLAKHVDLRTATGFHSLVDLQAAINRYLAEHNHSPKPFAWTADPDRIIAAANRGYQVLDSIHSHVRLSK